MLSTHGSGNAVWLALGLVIFHSPAFATEPLFGARQGIAILRNGHEVEGTISREGNQVVITLGEKGEIRLPASAVVVVCKDLHEAYEFKKKQLNPASATQHIQLARWCLRHGMLVMAAAEVERARQLEPETTGLEALQQQMELASPGADVPDRPTKVPVSAARADPAEHSLGQLSTAAMERFTNVVHPLLINRCATAGCHGPRPQSQFQLVRPHVRGSVLRQTTLKNLRQTLATINPDQPLSSPLLTMARSEHGQSGTSAIPPRDAALYRQLEDWVRMITAHSERPAMNSTETGSRLLRNPSIHPPHEMHSANGGNHEEIPSRPATIPNSPLPIAGTTPDTVNPAARSPDRQSSAPDTRGKIPFTPKDPFDPEIFNRLILGDGTAR